MTSKHGGAPLQPHHVYEDCWTMRQRTARNGQVWTAGGPRQLYNPCRMAPSLALSLAHQPSSTTHASVGSGAWFRCMGLMSSLTWSRRRDSAFSQLFTFRSLVVNSPLGLIATAWLCLRLGHSLCHHQFTAFNLSLLPPCAARCTAFAKQHGSNYQLASWLG